MRDLDACWPSHFTSLILNVTVLCPLVFIFILHGTLILTSLAMPSGIALLFSAAAWPTPIAHHVRPLFQTAKGLTLTILGVISVH